MTTKRPWVRDGNFGHVSRKGTVDIEFIITVHSDRANLSSSGRAVNYKYVTGEVQRLESAA